jgi:magnesium-transporting ATPase (P-type)
MTTFFFVLRQGGWEYGQVLEGRDPLYLQATTACLAAIVVAQVVNVFACRHSTESTLTFGLRSNMLLLVGVGVEIALILMIVYTQPGQALFGTAPLPAQVWLVALGLGLVFGLLEEFRKALFRYMAARR